MHYLSDPKDEHVPPSVTYLVTSKDGYNWTAPEILFPSYRIPDGYTKEGRTDSAKDLDAIMHQRVGFYTSKSGKLIAMGNYGIALDKKDDPNDGNGIGRVVREINKDGSFGPIYFIYYNHNFNEKNTIYPYFTRSKDKGFVKACHEILNNPRYRMQWVEEADRNDPLIPLHKGYKAYCDYTLPNGDIVALWKHALTSVSKDGGLTWNQPVERAKGFVNSNAKIWGQRLSDGTYATVYNPSEFRWPLAISLSKDGLFGITDVLSKFPVQMSGGQKQRVAAARSLISDPDIILADEPTGALDTKAARLLMEKLCEINHGRGRTILMVTHDPNAASFCSRILFIQDGVIFHELRRKIPTETREEFYARILQVMAQMGGGSANVL